MYGQKKSRTHIIPVLLLVLVLAVLVVFAVIGDADASGRINVGDLLYFIRNRTISGENGGEGALFSGEDSEYDGVPTSDVHYGRSLLASGTDAKRALQCYDYILGALNDRVDSIDFENAPSAVQLPKEVVCHIYELVIADHPELFWVRGGYNSRFYTDGTLCDISPVYTVSAADLPAMRSTFDGIVAGYLSGIDDTMSEYNRELELHDRIVNTCRYDLGMTNDQTYNAYGCLVNHLCVCEGYAKAFQVLLTKAGIQSMCVSGQADGGNHGWNIVRIDGTYYNVDVTWDDPTGDYDTLCYTYFNVPDDYISEDHHLETDKMPFTPPACTSWTANYYTVNNLHATLEIGSILDCIAWQAAAGKGVADEFECLLDRSATQDEVETFIKDHYNELRDQVIRCTDPSYSGRTTGMTHCTGGRLFYFQLNFE